MPEIRVNTRDENGVKQPLSAETAAAIHELMLAAYLRYVPDFPRLYECPLADVERFVILDRLQRHHGRRLPTAISLGIGLRTLGMKLKAYGVPPRGLTPRPGAGITRSRP